MRPAQGARQSRSRVPDQPQQGPAARLSRLRANIPKDASHLLVTSPQDVSYLTGFLGGDSYLLVPSNAGQRPIIISDSRFEEELEPQRAFCDVVMRNGPMSAGLTRVLADAGVGGLAFQPENVTLATREMIEKALKAASGKGSAGKGSAGKGNAGKGSAGTRARMLPASSVVAPLRMRKDAGEIKAIRAAILVQQDALLATLATLRAGESEIEVAARLEYEMKRRGSSAPAFESIVATGSTGSLPHYRPSARRRLKARDSLLIDWGATIAGYRSDMTRTIAFGGAFKGVMREVYEITRQAHERAVAMLGPGAGTREVDAAAREHITDAGYGERFGHGLGHGIGLNVHEGPSVSHIAPDTILEPGMIVTIEPGIYLPGVGGVRLENDYLITSDGVQNLCTLPLDIEWAEEGWQRFQTQPRSTRANRKKTSSKKASRR